MSAPSASGAEQPDGPADVLRPGMTVRWEAGHYLIAAVQLPDYGLASLTMLELPSPEKLVDDVLKAAQSRVDELVAAYGEGAGGVSIAVEAVAGHPGDVLCGAADGAELLVVGHRGRGASASRLIGSVGLHCVLHANCPVTVVRPDA